MGEKISFIDLFGTELELEDEYAREMLADESATRAEDVAVLEARMDTFTALPAGSTAGDAELMDIRVGADGATYANAGNAVREQVNLLKNSIRDNMIINILENYEPVIGKYYNGTENNSPTYNYYTVPVFKGLKYNISPKMRMYVIKNGNTVIDQDLTDKLTSFMPSGNGLAYITVYASDTPVMWIENSDTTLQTPGRPADSKAVGDIVLPIDSLAKTYNRTYLAEEFITGKYFNTAGHAMTAASYNYYSKIPVVKDNTYRFTGKGARYVVLYDDNNNIVQTAENVYLFTANHNGIAYVTEYADGPLEMFLDNIIYAMKEWTNTDVNGTTTNGSGSTTVPFVTAQGDIIHFKLNGYTGQYFSNCSLYAVVNGTNQLVTSLYSDIGEYIFEAPEAQSYVIYINRSQTEPSAFYLHYTLTNLSKNSVFNSLDRLFIENALHSKIYGKKIACLGDSFTYGVETYVKKMNDRYLSHAVNYGIASSRIVLDTTSGSDTILSFLNRYANMDDDADIITVFGGINDSYDIGAGLLTLGDINSPLNTSTFYGGLKLLVTNLMRKYPDKQIIGIIPPDCQTGQYYIENLPNVQEAEREVYAYYGIPIIDIRKDCYKMSTLPEMIEIYRSATNNIHPSNAGQEALCDTISAGIRRYVI